MAEDSLRVSLHMTWQQKFVLSSFCSFIPSDEEQWWMPRALLPLQFVSCPLPSILCSSLIHTRQIWGFIFDTWHEWAPPNVSIWTQQEVCAGD